MREARYRVWDKKCRIYLEIVGAEVGGKNTKFCGFKYIYCRPQDSSVKMKNPLPMYGGCVGFKLTDGVDSNRLVFEQDTGLKDKNGNSIWEGDILMDDTGEPIEYWVVKFSDGGFVGECIGIIENLFELTHLEIVGNINDDSELLEEK